MSDFAKTLHLPAILGGSFRFERKVAEFLYGKPEPLRLLVNERTRPCSADGIHRKIFYGTGIFTQQYKLGILTAHFDYGFNVREKLMCGICLGDDLINGFNPEDRSDQPAGGPGY
jgi:hypothetical protein